MKLRDETVYASYIEEWERLSHIDEWEAWSSHVLADDQPEILVDIERDLAELRDWLISRVWPGRYQSLEVAFENFRRVLQDFHETIRSRLEPPCGDIQITNKFYRIDDWDPPLHRRLSAEYEFHVDIVCDLMLELTRSANFIFDEVRRHIAHGYRLKDGNLIVCRGPDMNFNWIKAVPLYSRTDINTGELYPGLNKFYEVRQARDWCVGTGHPPR